MYCAKRTSDARLFVSEIEFDRSISRLMKGTTDAKTIIFPSTVRETYERAFSESVLQSVELNEGLKTIGEDIFCDSEIKKIIIPKSITEIDDFAFYECENLK